MTPIVVRAPGKLFVIGEYAVLEGGQALVVAVDTGIRCTVAPARRGRWRLRAPDLALDLDLGSSPVPTLAGDARAAGLVAAVAEGAATFGVADPLDVVVEATDDRSRAKRGLGGSAASVVAILGAFAARDGNDLAALATRTRLFEAASRVHSGSQDGRGSGADVATAVWGGWLGYTRGRATPLRPPGEPSLAAFWSGRPASTSEAIRRFDEIRASEWARRLVDRMQATLDRFWLAWSQADIEETLEALRDYGTLLDELARQTCTTGLDDGNGGETLPSGVVAKTSGAVGGDCTILFGFDAAETARVAEAWQRSGAERIELDVDPTGVRREAA